MGASRPEQVVENMQGFEVVSMLTEDVMAKINAVSVEGIEVD
jgi:aryl-alcohol dehydrogenase-like predicted oxidoreductase